MPLEQKRNRLDYFVACVTEFAKAFDLNQQHAFDYLDKHQGLKFLTTCYEAEHTVSFADAVQDLQMVCRQNGGRL